MVGGLQRRYDLATLRRKPWLTYKAGMICAHHLGTGTGGPDGGGGGWMGGSTVGGGGTMTGVSRGLFCKAGVIGAPVGGTSGALKDDRFSRSGRFCVVTGTI